MDELALPGIESSEVMYVKRRMFTGGLAAFGILLLILDAKTALSGAAEGVSVCLRVILPSSVSTSAFG